MYLVGIDVGTTNTKTVIFDVETGHICAVGSSRTITRHPVPDWSEFDAEDIWETVLLSIQAAVQQCDRPERICAISVASMGESAFPVDADGNILHPAIAWYDQRTAAEARWWENLVGRERIFTITGHIPRSTFGVNKLLWLRNHLPQVFERIYHWLSIEDFVLWKLSGSFATDYSIASRTMLFDQSTLTWSEALLEQAGLPLAWFPPTFPSGTAIGSVSKEVTERTGLPLQTIVSTGGHDHLCGALAAGVTRPGQLLESMGTASVLLAVSNAFHPSPELLASGCTCYANVSQRTYVTLGTLDFAGGALEWIVTLLYGQGKQRTVSPEIYDQALREAAEVPPGSYGATIIPSFLGSGTPYGQSSARGAMLGLTPSHNRPELVRALMEGLTFWLRDNIATFYRLGIAPLKPEIIVIGGTTQAVPLLQIKADITGCPIKVPQITEAAASGAALLAGIGANIFHSGEEAVSSIQHTVQIYEPDTQAVEKYNTIYEQTYQPARRLFI
ncbi:MAG TPA: FGGY family carbohydrate kinase [Ktedonobacteraceae bacterium]|nr:FGGY family carbohydrate kinase [Ktedonobacteraceae bacterium]